MTVRRSAIAGTWYPGEREALQDAVERHLAAADGSVAGDLVALIAPHAGLMYSGPVAAHAYRLLRDRTFDVAVIIGPSHFVGFHGAAVYASGGFETPLGVAAIDEACAADLLGASPMMHDDQRPHAREHSLEMQLPFVQHLSPDLPIVPVLVGYQTEETAQRLGEALAITLRGRRALLIASSDLSHYHDAGTASTMDGEVLDCVTRFDADALQRALVDQPEHACGGGPMVAVLRAARMLGAVDAIVLNYADSGDITGDKSSVVGYMAAAIGTFTP